MTLGCAYHSQEVKTGTRGSPHITPTAKDGETSASVLPAPLVAVFALIQFGGPACEMTSCTTGWVFLHQLTAKQSLTDSLKTMIKTIAELKQFLSWVILGCGVES